jgi:hypothetical protein
MHIERITCCTLLLLCTYTAWARSGIYGPWHSPVWILTFGLLLMSVVTCAHAAAEKRRAFFRDPLLYIGLGLNLFLLVQWLNAGGHLYVNMFTGEYNYTDPPLPGLPFSLEPKLSIQPLVWFVPISLALPVVRNLLGHAERKLLLWGLLANGAALGLFGLVQLLLGWGKMFGLIAIPGNPLLVATFDYPNHGGAFFYLLLALAVGLYLDGVEKEKSQLFRWCMGGLMLLFGTVALCSCSRAAVLSVLAIGLFAVLVWGWRTRRQFSSIRLINSVLLGGVVFIALLILFAGMGRDLFRKEVHAETAGVVEPSGYVETRGFQIPPALQMFKAHPLYGVGGWGYRSMVKLYLPEQEWDRLGVGKANVHCDPIQFLAEHGLIGFGLMSLGLGYLVWPWRRFLSWRFRGMAILTAFGCLLLLAHSLIDLPFRNPTILWHWLLFLAVVPLWAERYQVATCDARSPLRLVLDRSTASDDELESVGVLDDLSWAACAPVPEVAQAAAYEPAEPVPAVAARKAPAEKRGAKGAAHVLNILNSMGSGESRPLVAVEADEPEALMGAKRFEETHSDEESIAFDFEPLKMEVEEPEELVDMLMMQRSVSVAESVKERPAPPKKKKAESKPSHVMNILKSIEDEGAKAVPVAARREVRLGEVGSADSGELDGLAAAEWTDTEALIPGGTILEAGSWQQWVQQSGEQEKRMGSQIIWTDDTEYPLI